MSKLFLPLILQSDFVADFMALYTLCFIAIAQGGKRSPLYPALMHQRGRTIGHVQQRLQEGLIDDMLIQGVNAMLSTDALLGNFEHVETHARGARAVAAAHGYKHVGSSHPLLAVTLKRQLQWTDNMLNMIVERAPFTSAPAPNSALLLATGDEQLLRDFNEIPIGFRSLATQGKLSTKIISVLAEFSRWTSEQIQRSPQQLRPAIWHHLIPNGLSGFERCVALALCCLSEDKFGTGIHFFYRRSTQHLDVFLAENLTRDQTLTDCLTWAMFVLVGGRNDRYLTAEMRHSIIQRAYGELEVLRSWPKLEALLRRYYWADECAVRWFRTWQSLPL